MTTLQPLHDRIVVERAAELEVSKGGIFIPQTAKEKPIMGTVLSVGIGKYEENGVLRPLAIKVGDTVLFGAFSGSEVTVDEKVLLILKEDEVLGILHVTPPKPNSTAETK